MTQRISGPGLGLPLAQNLYPSQLYNAPYDSSNNRIALAPGDTLPIPAGDWFVGLGSYCVLQFLDPVSNTWNMGATAAWLGGHQFVVSDGFNVRVANLLGCPVSASVTNYGAGGYVQATTTITATGGTSTWVPIVGGQLTPTVISAGAGYGTVGALITTIGGVPPAGGISNNPDGLGIAWRPRPAQIGLTVTGIGTLSTQAGTIYDGGLFLTNAAPAFVVSSQQTTGGSLTSTTLGVIALTMGGQKDIVVIQPAP